MENQRVVTKSYKKVRPVKKKPKTQTPIETRRSLRAQGMPPDDTVKAISQSNSNTSPMLDLGPLCMRDAYRGTASDKLLMERILGFSKKPHEDFEFNGEDSIKGVCESGTGSSLELNSLSLNPENIARVVLGRITDLRFLPCSNATMIVAGNNFGNVGFWDVDSSIDDEEEDDGLHLYDPDHGVISRISIHQHSFSKGYGGLNIWDERIGKCSTRWNLHEHSINSIDFNSENYNIMATSSSDGTACIWDLRSINVDQPKTLKKVSHKRAVQSAYSPSGSSLAMTSMDNTVGIVTGVNYDHTSMIKHDNLSGFRAIWGWDDSHIFIGNMKRGVDVISPTLEKQYSLYKAHTCQQFHAGLMHTLQLLACLQEPLVWARFICGHWARNLSFFL